MSMLSSDPAGSILNQKSKQLGINNASPTHDISELYYLTLKDMLDFLFEVNINKITKRAVEVLESDLRTIINGIRSVLEPPSHDFVVARKNLEKVYIKIVEFGSLSDDSLARTTALVEIRNILSDAVQSWPSKSLEEDFFDIYISYNTFYRKEAVELATQLSEAGYRIWIDVWRLKPKDNWVPIAQDTLKRIRTVLVLVGPRGIGPRGQTEELEIILSTPGVEIVPVLLPNASPDILPNTLKKYVYLDFRTGLTDSGAFHSLISAISGARRKPSEPPTYPSEESTSSAQEFAPIQKVAQPPPTKTKPSRNKKKSAKSSKRRKTRKGSIQLRDIPYISGDINIAGGDIMSSVQQTAVEIIEKKVQRLGREDNRLSRRLLNAGFASREGRLIESFTPLVSNDFYDLRTDVGPLWEDKKSIVIQDQKAFFPEEKLPRTKNGYLVRTVFISEDFSPHQSSADMWVPPKRGQSFPVVEGKIAETAGVINLRIRAPRLGLFQSQRRAYGRLCLYYKGQLIQSAVVSAGIARTAGIKLKEPNKIEIDYVLTGNFENAKRLVNRRAKFDKKSKSRPVGVNITMNDDGSGHHRIMATYHLNSDEELTVPPAWKPYDSQSAQKELEKFRKILSSCYEGLDDNLGKTRARFGHDLLNLAILGDRLRELALSDLDIGSKEKTVKLWQEEFFKTLEQGTVIQIARTGPANYVFPWALVYEYPMPGPKYELCDVILEWGKNGIREKDPEDQCPYHDEEWHDQNIICPYGFWGLKHIIEQPLAAVSKTANQWTFDVTDKIKIKKSAIFGTGVTDDISDIRARDEHILKLAQKLQAQLKPQQPANDRQSALDMLRAPEIVYFLCHGEVDKDRTPYLSIGKHIDNDNYKIFPNTLGQWSRLRNTGLDLKQWSDIRPLVFINACHSIELKPGIVLNFVSAFADLGASGVIGTDVSMRDDMAIAVAEAILSRVADNEEVGETVREMRWEMLNRGNVLGLAYTPYSLANLHIQRRR